MTSTVSAKFDETRTVEITLAHEKKVQLLFTVIFCDSNVFCTFHDTDVKDALNKSFPLVFHKIINSVAINEEL